MPTRLLPGRSLIIEISLVIVVLVISASLILPVILKARDKPYHCCLAQVYQMATVCQMYNQDHKGRYPGAHWMNNIKEYLGNKPKSFIEDDMTHKFATSIDYGYSGLMVQADGSGVDASQIKSPMEVGILCDSKPEQAFPNGGLVGNTLQPGATLVTLDARHSGGACIGFADGHAECYATQGISYGFTRAFIMAPALGFINNPIGGINDFAMPEGAARDKITIGGEYCTASILCAAAEVWRAKAHAPVTVHKFTGQYSPVQHGANFLWGTGDDTPPTGQAIAIARDAVVVFTAKDSQLPRKYFQDAKDTQISAKHFRKAKNSVDIMDYPAIRALFSTGYYAKAYHAYTYGANSGTRRFFCSSLAQGIPWQIGKKAITVTNDAEMVDKVANDPIGIGYSSSALVDPERVQVVALRAPNGHLYTFPQTDSEHRWQLPASPDWPLTRTLYAFYGGKASTPTHNGIIDVMLAPNAPGANALHAGPLFQASYFLP